MKASGKFVLRIDPSLHVLLREEAREAKRSLNQWVVQKLTEVQRAASHLSGGLIQHCARVYTTDLLGIVEFGSVVRGEARDTSDHDILVILHSPRLIARDLYTL